MVYFREGIKPEPRLTPAENESTGRINVTETVQIGNRTLTHQDLICRLNQYQLLPKLEQELIIDDAIAPFRCTEAEEAQCCHNLCEY